MITVIDYGMGNLHSVKNALDFLGISNRISGELSDIKSADALILPGVGAFPDAAEALEKSGAAQIITEKALGGTPLLGICLGMQLLASDSEEVRYAKGLGLIKGSCRRIKAEGLKIPHMGWNDLTIDKPDCPILKYTRPNDYVYFVHSYAFILENEDKNLAAHTFYGEKIPAVVTDGKNVFGTQFHPEKSERIGLDILRAFDGFCRKE